MSVRSVQLFGIFPDGQKNPVAIDPDLSSVGTCTLEEVAVSMGFYFGTGFYNASVANNASIEMLFKMPADTVLSTALFGGVVAGGGDTLFEVFQAPTISADGTATGVLQVNQLSSNTNKVNTFHTPTTSADGTLIFRTFIPGGSGGNSVGGTNSPFQRLHVLPSTNYLLRATNLSGIAKPMSFNISMIELPPADL